MDIADWLRGLGLERYKQAFQENEINAGILHKLTAEDLKDIGVTAVGHRRRLLEAIAALDQPPSTESTESGVPTGAKSAGAERRHLTVLFCDLVGSTELSARLDPEDMGAVIRRYQECCAKVVRHWDGHLAKYMGDGVLVYFGYPYAHEDDAERAVHAGLDLTSEVARLGTDDGAPLAARAGIATGLVMVGDLIGEGAAQEEAVVGETPNLAARLQGLTEPGAVVIAQATRRLLGDLFELTDLGAHRLKGFAGTIHAWQVVGESGAESRFEALRGIGDTPMVGRDEELNLLISRWRRAKDGEGQGVLLVGEAGIGKSRISRALLDALSEEPHTRIRYQCSPYHRDSALWPVIQQLSYAAGLGADSPVEARLDKLERLLDRADGRAAAPLIAGLIGLDGSARYGRLDLTPQAQRTRTLDALVEQLLGLASEQPVLVMWEDAHWIDPTTLELIEQCLDRIAAAPVLILLTSRPDDQPMLAAHPRVTQLTLSRLGRAGVEAIIERLQGDITIPTETVAALIARTDGVPLFVEELTKAMLETGETTIPASLHDSLMARLDRSPEVKEVAQIAACIGREFDFSLLAGITDRSEADLLTSLDRLATAELTFRRGIPPNARYTFKHALVQDVAYESLLRTRRRQLHAKIAACLEERFPEIASAEPEVLAHHHSAAGQTEAAVGYWFDAGQRAAERSANQEAIEHLSQARSALDALPAGPSRDRRELDLLRILGPALTTIKGHSTTEAEPLLARVRELCRDLGDRDQDLAAIQALRTFYMVKGELAAARAQGEELLELGEHDHSAIYLFEGHRALGTVDVFSGRVVPARDHFEQALTFYDPARLAPLVHQPHGHPRVQALIHLSEALNLLGFIEQAERRGREAFDLASQLAHPYTSAQVLGSSSIFNLLCHRVHSAEEDAEVLLTLSLEHGFELWRVLGLGMLGWARALKHQSEAGVADMRDSIAAAETMGAVVLEVLLLVPLAEALGQTGEIQEGLSFLAKQRRLATDTGIAFCDAMARNVEGELRLKLAEPDPGVAETCFQDAVEIARRQEAKTLELHSAMRLARLWQSEGKRMEAHDLIAPIYDWFTEGFGTPDLKDAKALLDELEQASK